MLAPKKRRPPEGTGERRGCVRYFSDPSSSLSPSSRVGRPFARSTSELLGVAGGVAANTANIPQLQATAPVLGLIIEEAVVQDGYMNALTDGFGEAPA